MVDAEKKLHKLDKILVELGNNLDMKLLDKWGHYFQQLGEEWLIQAEIMKDNQDMEVAVQGLDVEKYS